MTYTTASNCKLTERVSKNPPLPPSALQAAKTMQLYPNQTVRVTTAVVTMLAAVGRAGIMELRVAPMKILIIRKPNSFGFRLELTYEGNELPEIESDLV